jgi:hypothetical protein
LPTVEYTPQQTVPLPTVEEKVTVTAPTSAPPVQQSNKEKKKNRSNNSE